MKGQILDFSIQTNTGYISGDDGKRYHFSGQEWKDNKAPVKGGKVDFDISPSGEAIQIYVVGGQGIEGLAQNFDQQVSRIINNDGKDESQYTMIDWTIKVLKNYINFEGRARRKEYWFFILATFVMGIIVSIIGSILHLEGLLSGLLNLALILPSMAVAARRLHDVNRSGWWQLISLTIIGIIPLIFWLASETKPESNQWGTPAK
jgi:uncharacterized membrane protein YhaH (DUF805 family)/YHS domain-containing protein